MADIASIDLSDVHWTVRFGGTTQRSLIRYFTARAVEQVMAYQKREHGRADPIPDMDPVEELAWRMADAVVDQIIEQIEELWDVVYRGRTAPEAVADEAAQAIKAVEAEYLSPGEFWIQATYDAAFGRPLHVADIDED